MTDFIERGLKEELLKDTPPRAVVLYGPRRIGKSTLLEHLVDQSSCRWFNGDLPGVAEELNFQTQGDVLNALLQSESIVIDEAHKVVAEELNFQTQGDVLNALLQSESIVIDEAHKVPNIGHIVKLLVDANERLEKPRQIFITSSSAFYLIAIKESALGRVVSRQMWPFSLNEIASFSGWGKVSETIDNRIVYGMMPIVYLQPEQARAYLLDYCEGYLLRDFFEENVIKYPAKLRNLLKYLAYNIGSEVSYDSLAREVGLNRLTVEDYIDRLQKASLIKLCPSFSRNLANEIKKGKKIYFFDTGIRNALINNFSPLVSRNDAGALWENFFFMERVKLHATQRDFTDTYFWRTNDRKPKELDFVEVLDNDIKAFECKLSGSIKTTPHAESFLKAYPNATVEVVSPKDCFKIFASQNH